VDSIVKSGWRDIKDFGKRSYAFFSVILECFDSKEYSGFFI
jgi:hypothetical protein